MAAYEKQFWLDFPDTDTPITADSLNHIEEGIYQASILSNLTVASDGYIHLDGEPQVNVQPEI